jgi:serine protease Do
MGIVSATGRQSAGFELDYADFIQTDAAINPGNSGGALVDAEGRLIGINTAILSRTGGNHGIGFAVPINLARSVMESLIDHGRVVRGFLGVNIQNVTPELARAFDLSESNGALVAEVVPGAPAEKAGLKSGDVVVSFDGKSIRDSHHLKMEVGKLAPGQSVKLKILRGGKAQEVEVKLQELPSAGLASLEGREQELDSTESLKGVVVSDLDDDLRAQLGAPEDLTGAMVKEVAPDSVAFEAGLREGDVIREINRKPVTAAKDAVAMTRQLKDKTILLRVWSKGGSRYLVVDETQAG